MRALAEWLMKNTSRIDFAQKPPASAYAESRESVAKAGKKSD